MPMTKLGDSLMIDIVKGFFGIGEDCQHEGKQSMTPFFAGNIINAIMIDYDQLLDGMKGVENVGPVGAIEDIASLTPGQLYDETYKRILKNTIARLEQKLKEFS